MNRLPKISNSVLIFLIFFIFILAGCRSGGKGVKKDADSVVVSGDNAAVYEDIKQAERIFYTLPSPLESAMLIKSAGAQFNRRSSQPYRKHEELQFQQKHGVKPWYLHLRPELCKLI